LDRTIATSRIERFCLVQHLRVSNSFQENSTIESKKKARFVDFTFSWPTIDGA
jgi:hypothetical protein